MHLIKVINMKKLLFGCLYLYCTIVFAQSQKNVYLLDSAHVSNRNEAKVMWLRERYLYNYNETALLSRFDKIMLSPSGQKTEHYYTMYDYDERQNKISQIVYSPLYEPKKTPKVARKMTGEFAVAKQEDWAYNNENSLDSYVEKRAEKVTATEKYTYDEQKRLTEILKKSAQDSYQYDATYKLISIRTVWANGDGSNNFEYAYEYDGCGKVIQKIRNNFSLSTQQWVPAIKYVFEYNEKGYKISETCLNGNQEGIWTMSSRDTYEYAKQGNVQKKASLVLLSNDIDPNEQKKRGGVITCSKCDTIKQKPITFPTPPRKPIIHLPPDTLLTTIYYEYDQNSNLTAVETHKERRKAKENSSVNRVVEKVRIAYVYDANNNMVEEIQYARQGESWETIRRKLQYWSLHSVVQQNTAEANANNSALLDAVILPQLKEECSMANPYRIGSAISCEGLEEDKSYQLLVFDLLGRLQYQSDFGGSSTTSINTALPLGTYLVVIRSTDNTFVETHKIILTY